MIKEKLFCKWWKKIWSFKFEKCINCWSKNFKHKSKWLCSSCFDKKRFSEKNYKEKRKIQNIKYFFKKKILLSLKKMDKKEQISFYEKEVKKMKVEGKVPLQAYIWGKIVELPFETLKKPKLLWVDKKRWEERKEIYEKYDEEMRKYKNNLKIFAFISSYYKNWG